MHGHVSSQMCKKGQFPVTRVDLSSWIGYYKHCAIVLLTTVTKRPLLPGHVHFSHPVWVSRGASWIHEYAWFSLFFSCRLGPWHPMQNLMAFRPIVADVFQFGPKWWADIPDLSTFKWKAVNCQISEIDSAPEQHERWRSRYRSQQLWMRGTYQPQLFLLLSAGPSLQTLFWLDVKIDLLNLPPQHQRGNAPWMIPS